LAIEASAGMRINYCREELGETVRHAGLGIG
jgi:hypothetical protein